MVFHIVANAHLDPVWLWDWREGLNEGLTTCRTILDLMDEDPELTFIRGEAAIYQHIEETDPHTFERIRQRIAERRWEIAGGVWVQPDTNLPATETFARHLVRGQNYFLSRFGKRAEVAWAADSFGHSAGLPEVYAAAGMRGFAFTRPAADVLPLSEPAFWWEGQGGSRILAYRPFISWYGSNRTEIPAVLDQYLAAACKCRLENVGVWVGLGNHGGGPTRRQIGDIRAWAGLHPEVKVVFSGLQRLFDAIYEEVAAKAADFLPTHRGELNFLFRGCYASIAKLKFAYREAEALVERAERTDSAISAATGKRSADLSEAWDAVLFNSFHDILPGSSIERACEDQLAWIGSARHAAQKTAFVALNALASRVESRVPAPPPDHPCAVPILVWNPHPHEYRGPLELEVNLDYRPLFAYANRDSEVPVEVREPGGECLPFQTVATEHSSIADWPWRRRVVVAVKLPPMGWSVLSVGWVEGATVPVVQSRVSATMPGEISNGIYVVRAAVGGNGIQIFRDGKAVLDGPGLSAITVEDPWGSWGGMSSHELADADDLSTVRDEWTVKEVQILESGPMRAMLWVKLRGGNSWMDLTFSLYNDRAAVDVSARVLWNERSARLKLVMPAGDQADFEVPGGVVRRGPLGEVPGGKWVRVEGERGSFGFVSDALYAFDCKEGSLRATVVRASRYANDVKTAATERPWLPAADCGELKFGFVLSPGGDELAQLSAELQQPPVTQMVTPRQGDWPRQGSLVELSPTSVHLLALKPAEDGDGWILRAQQGTEQSVQVRLNWQGESLDLGCLRPWQIGSWRLTGRTGTWKVCRSDILESR